MKSLLPTPSEHLLKVSNGDFKKIEKALLKEKPVLSLPESTSELGPEQAWHRGRAVSDFRTSCLMTSQLLASAFQDAPIPTPLWLGREPSSSPNGATASAPLSTPDTHRLCSTACAWTDVREPTVFLGSVL